MPRKYYLDSVSISVRQSLLAFPHIWRRWSPAVSIILTNCFVMMESKTPINWDTYGYSTFINMLYWRAKTITIIMFANSPSVRKQKDNFLKLKVPTLWNSIPPKIRMVPSLLGFQRPLKTWIWCQAWVWCLLFVSGSCFVDFSCLVSF